MITFSFSIDIAAPADVVWGVMFDVERWHEWTASVRSVRVYDKLPGEPLRIGSRAFIRQPKFPPALWTVTAIEPGRSFTWQNRAPGILVHAHHSVAPIEAGTRATLGLRYEGLFGPLLAKLTTGITNRYLAMEAAGLKRRSEERYSPVKNL